MAATTLIAATWPGIARAERGANGAWAVEHLLVDRDVRCLAADPLKPAVVYAGTQGDGVLRSNDRGRTWRPAGMAGQIVKTLAVSPHEPSSLYAGTKPPALFVSRDSGESWHELPAFRRATRWYLFTPSELPPRAYVKGLALSPSDPRVIVAGVEVGAVLRSEDGGASWSGHLPGALRDPHWLTFHATRGEWVYEGGNGGGARSHNGGLTWVRRNEGLDRRYGWAVAADPERPDIWYISSAPSPWKAHAGANAEAAIFRSREGGAWERLAGGLPQPLTALPYALLTNPAAPGQVYAGLGDGDVWHSDDYGDTWRRLPFNVGAIHHAVLLP